MIKPKKHSVDSYYPFLVQARDTYLEYWCQTDLDLLDDAEIDEYVDHVNHILFENEEFEENYMFASDLDKFTPLHTCEYELELDGSLPEKAHQGVIVVIKDSHKNKTLILDGNHRRNTLIKYCPDQQVLVLEFEGTLP